MKSTQQKLYDLHWKVGDYLYSDHSYIQEDSELWDFYDTYPKYVENMLIGKCSLTDSLNFDLSQVDAEIDRVQELLKLVQSN